MTSVPTSASTGPIEPARGFRYHQLRSFTALLEAHSRAGTLIDVGTGEGWLPRSWAGGPALGFDRWASPTWGDGRWAIADTAAVPVRDGTASTCTAVAALGAYEPARLASVLAELARIVEPGGVLAVLVSHRSRVYDTLALHRLLSRYRWSSFTSAELRAALEVAGFDVVVCERRGGLTTLLAEWGHAATRPLCRWRWGASLHRGVAELDRRGFAAPRQRGRYLYVIGRRR